jgi:nucleoside phosphorylase
MAAVIHEDERRVDVVILTAIPLEYDEVLKVDAGAVDGSRWEEVRSESGLPVAFRRFTGTGARPLRVAVAVAPDMGAPAAVATLLPLVEWLQPRCIAMCGVCAGRPGKGVLLGDVIAADQVFYYDTGKQLPDRVEQDLRPYPLRDDWKVALRRMDPVARFRQRGMVSGPAARRSSATATLALTACCMCTWRRSRRWSAAPSHRPRRATRPRSTPAR